jgi:UPF0755 protein
MSIRYFLFLILVTAVSFYAVFTVRTNQLSYPEALVAENKELLLFHSLNAEDLAELLYVNEVEFDREEFLWAARIYNRNNFLSGRYVLDGGVDYSSFLGKLARGEQDPKRIIVRAGQTYERFFNRVPTQFRFTSEELRQAMRDTTYITETLGLEPHLLFGRMIPNTYEMFWTISPYQFIERMLAEFDRAVTPLNEKAEAAGLSIDELITFASIIELEALYDIEKPKIAGLYWNRINQRWRLQADPTVSYALGERRRLTFADYRLDHPYNTYRINGLPPGPITNPAMSSIMAVLEPESHPYMFMVATPEGYHTFTRSYAEHRRESAKWTQWLREQRRIRAEREREQLRQQQLLQAIL